MDAKRTRELIKVSWAKQINEIKTCYAGVFNQMRLATICILAGASIKQDLSLLN